MDSVSMVYQHVPIHTTNITHEKAPRVRLLYGCSHSGVIYNNLNRLLHPYHCIGQAPQHRTAISSILHKNYRIHSVFDAIKTLASFLAFLTNVAD